MVMAISIDKEIKDKAFKRAKDDNLSISFVVRMLLSDYANGKIQIGTRLSDNFKAEVIEVDPETQKLMDRIVKKWNEKNK
ncbi:MAG: hypothetical protein US89_C0005G0079 [Candidatus Peregrinibacteria bacterium GW2011_GWF2_38_29]|nr:MAG: hypothetical protein US89_C0005G0079 [Candidatus Peregrinibacteria bacterium GW2011_GWF2_38_29]HBB02666.1 hypothetical protein [Candidatus Peregrinibacteria bacterium]